MARIFAKINEGLWAGHANFWGSLSLLKEEVPGATFSKERPVCFFAHYDAAGNLSPSVRSYLEEIGRQGFQIVFITTSPRLSGAAKEWLSALGVQTLRRMNVSLDFGSWKMGIDWASRRHPGWLHSVPRVLLANDSVFGPFGSLDAIFENMKGQALWGLTESEEFGRHLQSYFLVFEKPAINSGFFEKFWNSFRYVARKSRLIRRYEVGLSELARSEGVQPVAWIPREKFQDGRNPTLFHWRELIEKQGFPFLKTELLRLNRFQSEDVPNWRAVVRSRFPAYRVQLVEASSGS